jgi:hypothetical protein
MAFRHTAVGLEGIRQLIHLNPIEFRDEADVISDLRTRLPGMFGNSAGEIGVHLRSIRGLSQDNHAIRRLEVSLYNGSARSFSSYIGKVCVPSDVLEHWGTIYPGEILPRKGDRRCFRFTEEGRETLLPEGEIVFPLDYCLTCIAERATKDTGFAQTAETKIVEATAWIDGRKYEVTKTLKELTIEGDELQP